jgi:hypothetical protein
MNGGGRDKKPQAVDSRRDTKPVQRCELNWAARPGGDHHGMPGLLSTASGWGAEVSYLQQQLCRFVSLWRVDFLA